MSAVDEYDSLTKEQQDEVITNLTSDLVSGDYKREEKSLELKKILIKANYLKSTDKYEFVIKRQGRRSLELHLLLQEKFALALHQTKTKHQKWSDFDVYNNKKLLKLELKSGEVKDFEKQYNSLKRRLVRLEEEVIDFFDLVGMEEYKTKLEEAKAMKKKQQVLKTASSMNEGVILFFLRYFVLIKTFLYSRSRETYGRIPRISFWYTRN
jgi:hypothetical protein